MALLTTTIGSFPKPTYVPTPDWFRMGNTTDERVVNAYSDYLRTFDTEMEKVLDRAVQEIVKAQVEVGIDIPTDGEVRREHYINYHCRHVDGVDFERLTKRSMRDGGWVARVPTIRSKFQAREPFLVRDFLPLAFTSLSISRPVCPPGRTMSAKITSGVILARTSIADS